MNFITWEIYLKQHMSLSKYSRPPVEALVRVCVRVLVGEGVGVGLGVGGGGWRSVGKHRVSGSLLGP